MGYIVAKELPVRVAHVEAMRVYAELPHNEQRLVCSPYDVLACHGFLPSQTAGDQPFPPPPLRVSHHMSTGEANMRSSECLERSTVDPSSPYYRERRGDQLRRRLACGDKPAFLSSRRVRRRGLGGGAAPPRRGGRLERADGAGRDRRYRSPRLVVLHNSF